MGHHAVSRLVIRNYRGIAALDVKIGRRGFIASGTNGAGKTTILRAIRAVLNGQDVAPDAIRHDADRAEILLDIDEATVVRLIGQKSTSVSVRSANGFKAEKPQKFLTDLFGNAALDPIDIFLAKPKERRAMILGVLPVTIL